MSTTKQVTVDVEGGALGQIHGELTITAAVPSMAELFERMYARTATAAHEIMNGVTPLSLLLADIGDRATALHRKYAINTGGALRMLEAKFAALRSTATLITEQPTTNLLGGGNDRERLAMTDQLRTLAAIAVELVSELEKGRPR